MNELAEKFFQSELSEAEADRLEAALAEDPALAERFSALALAEYAKFKKPKPAWSARRPGAWRAFRLPLIVLGLAGAAWCLWPESSHERPSLAWEGGAFEENATPVPAPRESEGPQAYDREPAYKPQAAAPQQAPVLPEIRAEEQPRQARKAGRIAVVVPAMSPAQVRVSVRDASGRVVRRLYEGVSAGGRDSRDATGARVAPGDYEIVVEGAGRTLVKRVKAMRRGMP
jgi:hypothetical protein